MKPSGVAAWLRSPTRPSLNINLNAIWRGAHRPSSAAATAAAKKEMTSLCGSDGIIWLACGGGDILLVHRRHLT